MSDNEWIAARESRSSLHRAVLEMLEKDPYNTICTPQQVQYCAGSLSFRRMLDPETELYKLCKKFMQCCSYDVQLAKRIMSTVVYEKKGHKTWI